MDAGDLRRLSPEVRRELLLVLESDARVRADVVRQFHERGHDLIVDVLIELEADGGLRERVVQVLRRVT